MEVLESFLAASDYFGSECIVDHVCSGSPREEVSKSAALVSCFTGRGQCHLFELLQIGTSVECLQFSFGYNN
jgi:hypothetical protein